jgi:predicted esterase
LLLTPTARKAERLLVLFHGLGETVQVKLGLYAWARPYGLLRAYDRLLAAPLVREPKEAGYLTDEHRARLNAELGQLPFGGLAVACPFTPNVYDEKSTPYALDRYADWVAGTLLPELAQRLSLAPEAGVIGLDGVSLGGYMALEVFLRKPEAFAAFGCVQGAFGVPLAEVYARRVADVFARVGARPVHVATSRDDPFRPAAERLSKRLLDAGANVDFVSTPGPHSQSWLREVGSLDVLRFYDRALRSGAARAEAKG